MKEPVVKKPWGEYQVIIRGSDWLVKVITVLPGHRLSLQSHKNRFEEWIVSVGNGLLL